MRAHDGIEDGRLVQGAEDAQVDDLSLDALGGELIGGGERLAQHPAVGDQADVAAGAPDRSEY